MTNERPPLEDMTLRQLRRVASEYEVSRYSRMRKDQLIEAILQAMQSPAVATAPALATAPEPATATPMPAQETVEAAKFDVGQQDLTGGELAVVDEGLADLPDGYGDSRIVLMPRDPQWAYAYWDVSNSHKEALRQQGGVRLALRFYDVTDIDLNYQRPHSVQQYECDELAREWYLPVPVSDRNYLLEIGYIAADGRWLVLARSNPIHVPPVYPSEWLDEQFIQVGWEEDLRGKTFLELVPPGKKASSVSDAIYSRIFGLAEDAEAQRVAGSLYGSMQQVPGSMQQVPGSIQHVAGSVQHVAGSVQHVAGSIQQIPGAMEFVPGAVYGSAQMTSGQALESFPISSYVFASGIGMWAGAAPGAVGAPNFSGIGMSGYGLGFSASAPPIRPRKFWLVADAELIVYGATEPDATVTIGGRPIKLNPDGTFRFQMSFQDGLIDYPIMAVAADGEQTRAIHMKFTRETPERRTNTKDEAVLEWLG